jgi:hypothetical protein
VDAAPVYGVWFVPRDKPQPDAVVGDATRSAPF